MPHCASPSVAIAANNKNHVIATVEHGVAANLVIQVQNDSDDEITMKALVRCVIRQNFSRDPKRGGSWWSRREYDFGSIRQEGFEGANPRARGAHIYAYIYYKGPVENRSGLCRSIVTMVQPSESLL